MGIAIVHVRSWQAAYRGLVPQEYLDHLEVDQRYSVWERILGEAEWPRVGTFVAEYGGDVVGFASICPTRDDDEQPASAGELAAIYLLPEGWGKGLGRELMASVLSALSEAGFDEATLWVLDTNSRARRFLRGGRLARGWCCEAGCQKGFRAERGPVPARAALSWRLDRRAVALRAQVPPATRNPPRRPWSPERRHVAELGPGRPQSHSFRAPRAVRMRA
jgi:GNAT superfamily N-acetyltransferase